MSGDLTQVSIAIIKNAPPTADNYKAKNKVNYNQIFPSV